MAYEIVESQTGQPSKMEKLGWATKGEIGRFKKTVNSWRVLGKRGRHGKTNEPAPADPTTLGDARTLVREIVLAWIEWLAAGRVGKRWGNGGT